MQTLCGFCSKFSLHKQAPFYALRVFASDRSPCTKGAGVTCLFFGGRVMMYYCAVRRWPLPTPEPAGRTCDALFEGFVFCSFYLEGPPPPPNGRPQPHAPCFSLPSGLFFELRLLCSPYRRVCCVFSCGRLVHEDPTNCIPCPRLPPCHPALRRHLRTGAHRSLPRPRKTGSDPERETGMLSTASRVGRSASMFYIYY